MAREDIVGFGYTVVAEVGNVGNPAHDTTSSAEPAATVAVAPSRRKQFAVPPLATGKAGGISDWQRGMAKGQRF